MTDCGWDIFRLATSGVNIACALYFLTRIRHYNRLCDELIKLQKRVHEIRKEED